MDSRRLHLLTQYLWPDDAPTGIYAEQLADALTAKGHRVRLVAGSGTYRPGERSPPATPILRLEHRHGRRGRLVSTALEYVSVERAFARYIEAQVEAGDAVLVTSAPPTTVFLHRHIRRRGASSIYWLQDFYPQLVRGVWDFPDLVARRWERVWRRSLAGWDHVVKAAGNLGYSGANAVVFRNWNTLDPGPPRAAVPRTALYSGNLGYGHDIAAFLALCSALRADGFDVTVRGDGPGMQRLPSWIRVERPLTRVEDLLASYWSAEVHLVAADPRLRNAIFPSKLWNSLAVGRPVRASGFEGEMAEELRVSLASDYRQHLPQLAAYLSRRLRRTEGET